MASVSGLQHRPIFPLTRVPSTALECLAMTLMDESEYRRLWREFDRERRKEILASLRRGTPLSDPLDAQVAEYLAVQRKKSQWTLLASPVMLALIVLAIRIATGSSGADALIPSMLGGLMLAAFAIPAWRKWKVVLLRTQQVNRDIALGPDND